MTNTFTVIYRTGGTMNARWHRCAAVATIEDARKMQDDIRRGGRKALIHKTNLLDSIGLPSGYEA